MGSQLVLTICLAVLVVALTVLLVVRSRRERQLTAVIRDMNLAEFSDFLRTNSMEGGIQSVAGKVSELLKKSFGCELIIFLRKKRHLLELNYYHGLQNFDRHHYSLVLSRQLTQKLQGDFLPRGIEEIKDDLPAAFYETLQESQADVYFPVYWRDNLYGLYFIRSTIETRSPSFRLLTAGLAQSLAAAYHIKWHEVRYDGMQKQLDGARAASRKEVRTHDQLHANILKLVRHREPDTIVPRLIGSIKQDLALSRVAYLYQGSGDDDQPLVFQTGLTREISVPRGDVFRSVLKKLSDRDQANLDSLAADDGDLKDFTDGLKQHGLKYATVFPLTIKRAGVLLWSGNESTVTPHLLTLRPHVAQIMDNAESYRRLEEMSYTDNLTGLGNQRYLSKRLEEEISRARRYRRQLALIFFDLDDLKKINDSHGHLAGDAVLRQVGRILCESVRSIDIVARYGGDEFCIIMPEAGATTCRRLMDRLKTAVSEWPFVIDDVPEPIRCSISQGGALYPEHAEDPRQLVFTADMALLKAKEAGRNTSLLYQPESPTGVTDDK
ncbi:MAG: GGDEF domain-containing protein [bacterium]